MTIRRTALLVVAATVFASAPSMAAAASKTPPSIKVSSARIVKKDGVTCAFVPSPPTGTWPSGQPSYTPYKRLFRIAPGVSATIPIPDSWQRTHHLAVSDRYATLAGPDYLTCVLSGPKGHDCTSFTLGLIDTETGESKTLAAPSDQLAVVTLAASTESKRFVAQAVRLTDKKYMIGIIDGASKSVKWQETGSLKFRWVGTFK